MAPKDQLAIPVDTPPQRTSSSSSSSSSSLSLSDPAGSNNNNMPPKVGQEEPPESTQMTASSQQAELKASAASAAAETEEDMRFKLTQWERKNVIRLKEACEKEGIKYDSIFQLAKYVLVAKSTAKDSDKKADDKRFKESFRRIKEYRETRDQYDMDSIDLPAALAELEEAEPKYFFQHNYVKDQAGHVVVAIHLGHPPSDFVFSKLENGIKYFAVEQWRCDLAAADMVEARQGMALMAVFGDTGDFSYTRLFQCARFHARLRKYHKEITSHRLRKLYAQAPIVIRTFLKPFFLLLPKKIRQRIVLVPHLADFEPYMTGGHLEDQESVQDWCRHRSELYKEAEEKIRLD